MDKEKGIKVSDKDPLYVLKINSDKNEIIVGPREKLGKKKINLNNLNLLVDKKEFDKRNFCKSKIYWKTS